MIAAGGALGAYGSYESGKANRDIDRANAEVARMKAEQSVEAGEQQAAIQDVKGRQLEGAQRAGFAGQGVVSNAGTAGMVESSSEAMSEMDKLLIRTNARRQAWGYQSQANDYENQAEMAYKGGVTGALSSLIGAGGQVALASARSPGAGTTAPAGGNQITFDTTSQTPSYVPQVSNQNYIYRP